MNDGQSSSAQVVTRTRCCDVQPEVVRDADRHSEWQTIRCPTCAAQPARTYNTIAGGDA